MGHKESNYEFSLEDKDLILTEIDKIVDRSIWYKLDPFYKIEEINRRIELEDFYFDNYLEDHREKVLRLFLQLCLTHECLIEDATLYPDKIDPRMEDYDYVYIDDMEIEHLAFLIRNIEPCGEFCCTRFYFWDYDSVIEINSLKSIYIFTESREFLETIENVATAEGLYVCEEHYNVEDSIKLNELMDKLLGENGDEISSENSVDASGTIPPYNLKNIQDAVARIKSEND